MKKSRALDYLQFVQANWRFLSFGILMACSSSFGQTWFIGLFTPNIESTFNLSHGEWGTIFMIGTLFSAALLTFTGSFIDKVSLKYYSVLVCGFLAVACAAIAVTPNVMFLVLAVFLLRHAGQGLATHVAVTGMIKHFYRNRGKAVAIATMGFPIGRGVLPILITTSIVAIGWRETYLACVIIIVFIILPAVILLLRGSSQNCSESRNSSNSVTSAFIKPRFEPTLIQTLQKPLIYLIIPALLAPSFFDTALSFHILPIAELKSWPVTWITTGYTIYGIATILSSIWIGPILDKVGSKYYFAYSLIPYLLGLLVLVTFETPIWAWVYLGLFGVGSGLRATIVPVVLSEFYGTQHIGAIRSFVATLGVLASAIGPPTLGFALDQNVSISLMTTFAITYFILAIFLALYASLLEKKTKQP